MVFADWNAPALGGILDQQGVGNVGNSTTYQPRVKKPCILIAMIIISHHHSAGALQSRGYCQQGAWAANDFHGTGEIRVGSGGGKCGSCRGCRW